MPFYVHSGTTYIISIPPIPSSQRTTSLRLALSLCQFMSGPTFYTHICPALYFENPRPAWLLRTRLVRALPRGFPIFDSNTLRSVFFPFYCVRTCVYLLHRCRSIPICSNLRFGAEIFRLYSPSACQQNRLALSAQGVASAFWVGDIKAFSRRVDYRRSFLPHARSVQVRSTLLYYSDLSYSIGTSN